jgi:hypothetical protein
MRGMKQLALCTLLLVTACGASRSTFARYPGSPAAFDPAGSDPKAVELAQKVFAAAGGPGNWDKAKQIRWEQTITQDGKEISVADEAWDRWNARHWGRLKQGEKWVNGAHELYGDFSIAYLESANGYRQALSPDEKAHVIDLAKKAFNVNTAVMCLPFVMMEPGVKLVDKGPIKENEGEKEYEQIELIFPAADTARPGSVSFDAYVDRESGVIHRVDYTTPQGHFAYVLDGWVTVGGLKFAGKRTTVGAAETITVTNVTVGDPDDRLYVATVQ